MEVLIAGLAAKFPVILTIFAAMGASRAIFKAFQIFARAVVQATSNVKDDAFLDGVEKSKVYVAFGVALDYLASIKLPGIK